MVNIYKKGYLILFFTLIVAFSTSCGSPTSQIQPIPTSLKNVSRTSIPNTTGMQSTAVAHAPTMTPTNVPLGEGNFPTLPVGSPLPGDAECASRVRYSSWEPRPDNATANNTNVYAQGYRLTGSDLGPSGYEQRATGNFTGTTDEILQWGACKWGIDVNIVRAQAEQESNWNQSELGDCDKGGETVPETNGCQSVGILQIKGANIPPDHPGTWPYALESTAFNVDYTLAVLRACFEGKETWLGDGYQAGDLWGCVGRWFSGDWYQTSQDYIASVQNNLANKDWLSPDFSPN